MLTYVCVLNAMWDLHRIGEAAQLRRSMKRCDDEALELLHRMDDEALEDLFGFGDESPGSPPRRRSSNGGDASATSVTGDRGQPSVRRHDTIAELTLSHRLIRTRFTLSIAHTFKTVSCTYCVSRIGVVLILVKARPRHRRTHSRHGRTLTRLIGT